MQMMKINRSKPYRRHFIGLLTSAVVSLGAGVGSTLANDTNSFAEYKVSLLGLPIANLKFQTEIKGEDFKISGSIKSSALADMIEKTRGTTLATGKLKSDKFLTRDYLAEYTTGDEKRRLGVSFNDKGEVTKSIAEPTPKTLPESWVKVEKEHLINVLDPMTSLILPNDGSALCSRTIPVFDGETRLDFKLSHKGYRRFKTDGFKGRVVACNIQFIPKAGYRSNHESVRYLQNLKNMEVWFAKSPMANVYAPVVVKVPTKVGDVRVWATRFSGS